MSKYKFDAVIFDLDGVITKTALVHSRAWKKMFDEYLKQRAEKFNEEFKEFSHTQDYLPYVDGKPRYKGVDSFLRSRGIELSYGDPQDSPNLETVCGIGNRKNIAFNEILKTDGVEVYPSTVELIKKLKEEGIHVGVASSSKNCETVLKAAGLLDLMETRVDGVVSAELGLHGKPEADIFTTAADNMGVTYDRAVVVEDAVSGVQAGRNGNFGLVLGIAREDNEAELQENGADIVVSEIDEIGFEGILEWFLKGLEDDNCSLSYHDYDLNKEKSRESLLTVGNGYFGTRGCMEEISACNTNYPGTYIAGLFNRRVTKIAGRDVENEDFVNCPNWTYFRIKIKDGDWLDFNKDAKILQITRKLHFKTGQLVKELKIRDNNKHELLIRSKRIADMGNPNLAAITYDIVPLNFNGTITVKTGIDGDIINNGVVRYRQLNQQHLEPVDQGFKDDISFVRVKTTQSETEVLVAEKTNAMLEHNELNMFETEVDDKGKVFRSFKTEVSKDRKLAVEKLVYIKKNDNGTIGLYETDILEKYGTYNNILEESIEAWEKIWKEIDIKLEGDRLSQKLLRLHLYHLMVSVSPNNENIDASVGARGLHGEAYRGHIFWDELYILPFYDIHFRGIAKSLLMYRYRRLDEARKYAEEYGYKGAMYPWQSGSSGREETQVVHLNPLTGEWGPDHSSFQRHVSLAIAYNIWTYYWITDDIDFIKKYGLEMMLEICRFWSSKAEYNEQTGRYSIPQVMGPDEFHEMHKGAEKGGLTDNAYTNIMVVWMIRKIFILLNKLNAGEKKNLFNNIGVQDSEIEHWDKLSHKMNLLISNEDIIAQFDGYFELKELDWDHYRQKYENIYRMDRILKAEGKSADEYKVAKQADTLMTFYNLNKETVDAILESLGYHLSKDYLRKNLEYYLARTSHGSTLSRVVHAYLAAMTGNHKLSWELYADALSSDFNDIQGGTTAEGIHTGVMAGTVLIALTAFAGVNLQSEFLSISPKLPDYWRSVVFKLHFKGSFYEFEITKSKIIVRQTNPQDKTTYIMINGNAVELKNEILEHIDYQNTILS